MFTLQTCLETTSFPYVFHSLYICWGQYSKIQGYFTQAVGRVRLKNREKKEIRKLHWDWGVFLF